MAVEDLSTGKTHVWSVDNTEYYKIQEIHGPEFAVVRIHKFLIKT